MVHIVWTRGRISINGGTFEEGCIFYSYVSCSCSKFALKALLCVGNSGVDFLSMFLNCVHVNLQDSKQFYHALDWIGDRLRGWEGALVPVCMVVHIFWTRGGIHNRFFILEIQGWTFGPCV